MIEPSHGNRISLPAVSLDAAAGFLTDSHTPAQALKQNLAALYDQPFRRIDRFIQLALIGAGRCAGGNALAPRSGLYMATGYAGTSNMYTLMEATYHQGIAPRPFDYVNSVANAAGFHIAKTLGIHGRNISLLGAGSPSTVIRTLQLAVLDLWQGHVEQALVGFVHEAHLWRDGVPEGSHWFLLSRPDGETKVSVELRLNDHCGADVSPERETPPADLASSDYYFPYPRWLTEWVEKGTRTPLWLGHEAAGGRGLLFRRV